MAKFSFHCQNYKASQLNAIDRHNRRLNKKYHSNPDIDIARSHDNRVYVCPETSLYQDCKKKIQKEVIGNGGRVTKISNWVTECIFSYSDELPPYITNCPKYCESIVLMWKEERKQKKKEKLVEVQKSIKEKWTEKLKRWIEN